MKIVFICGSLEKGKDGIGDYTHKLCGELALQNITVVMVSISDKYVKTFETGEDDGVQFYRIPSVLSWKEKGDKLIEILITGEPVDWISIQFVAFAFNSKGLVFNVRSFFDRLKQWKLHFMMHELWIAEEKQASLKMRLWGALQKLGILSLIKRVKPEVIQTSMPLYQKMLTRADINAGILPLFSNIGYVDAEAGELSEMLPPDMIENRSNYVMGCLFGSIYYESWDLSTLFAILKKEHERSGKRIVIISLGKLGYGKEFWDGLPAQYPFVEFVTLGAQEEQVVSKLLTNYIDFGIITTPVIIAGKSGSYMAFLEHGIPVFGKQNELTFDFAITDNMIDNNIITVKEGTDFNLPARNEPVRQLNKTAKILVQTLKTLH